MVKFGPNYSCYFQCLFSVAVFQLHGSYQLLSQPLLLFWSSYPSWSCFASGEQFSFSGIEFTSDLKGQTYTCKMTELSLSKSVQSLHRLSTATIYSFNVHLSIVRMFTRKNINLSSKVCDKLNHLFLRSDLLSSRQKSDVFTTPV